MKKDQLLFTTGQFADMHHLNKRTLHYYDGIGLFSPAKKGENEYRYYTYMQSAELEHILALRELGMSIDEIKEYMKTPDAEGFMKISSQKLQEIEQQMRRLKELKTLLGDMRKSLQLCGEICDGKIEVIWREKEYLLLTPMKFGDTGAEEMKQIMSHLQAAWEQNRFKCSCGSYLSLDKVKAGEFDIYDGVFTPVLSSKKKDGIEVRPEGNYLCGYCIGDWSHIPSLYQKMLAYASDHSLELEGNCYETGMNEFAISSMEEYVTRIEIRIV